MANTARCFGAPNGIRVPAAVISKGPKTPNPRPVFLIALPASRSSTALAHFERIAAVMVAIAD